MFLSPIIDLIFNLFSLLLLARAVLSWLNLDPYNPIVRFLYQITEPVLAPIRKVVGPMGGLDLSPMIAIIIILVLRSLLRSVLGI